ncbi:hypothetical protein PVAP13_4KG295700 [Panicum virgatum]|uniref:Uncharacterized protein n=1 Tax=Panicum virgatum TaxID=38727 RepID=A0A8T0TUW3_PANVG|nr:hypothetical protein PVAP13_4KG295700 [Panicum virgatum]
MLKWDGYILAPGLPLANPILLLPPSAPLQTSPPHRPIAIVWRHRCPLRTQSHSSPWLLPRPPPATTQGQPAACVPDPKPSSDAALSPTPSGALPRTPSEPCAGCLGDFNFFCF